MGAITLLFTANGNIPSEEKWNQLKSAMVGDLPCRSSAGIATNEAGSLGTSANNWDKSYSRSIEFDSLTYSYNDVADNANLGSMDRLVDTKTSHTPSSGYSLVDTYTITTRPLPVYISVTIKNKGISSTNIGAQIKIGTTILSTVSTGDNPSSSIGGVFLLSSSENVELYTSRIFGTSTTCTVEVIMRELL